uniref:Uncharacterized protein n=1 Tax=Rhizophora mucronata TaxID=61149 RepID=A0A2P2QSB1_RHIMU
MSGNRFRLPVQGVHRCSRSIKFK